MESRLKKVLIVDDDPVLRRFLRTYLVRYGFSAVTCGDGREAIAVLQAVDIDAVITDVRMPHADGRTLVAWVHKHRPHLPLLVMTAKPSPRVRRELGQRGVVAYLEKPVEPAHIVELLRRHGEGIRNAGDLRDLELLAYLDNLLLTRRRMVVEVVSAEGRLGRIFVDEGALVHADFGERSGEEAFLECLSQTRGSWCARPWVEPPLRSVARGTDELMIEALRRHLGDQRANWETHRAALRSAASRLPPGGTRR